MVLLTRLLTNLCASLQRFCIIFYSTTIRKNLSLNNFPKENNEPSKYQNYLTNNSDQTAIYNQLMKRNHLSYNHIFET